MLTGQKVIDVHASKVVSLADVQTTVVDFKTKKKSGVSVCMLPFYIFSSENVTFNLVLNESTVRYYVSSSDVLEETKMNLLN